MLFAHEVSPETHQTFEAHCDAEQLLLIAYHESGRAVVVRMTAQGDSQWRCQIQLEPGIHKLRYYAGGPGCVRYFGPAPTVGSIREGLDAVLRVNQPAQDAAAAPSRGEDEEVPCEGWFSPSPL